MPHPYPHPQPRVHGMGCIDMNVLWRPFPAYAGQDPANASNYDWGIADQCMANVCADPNLPHLRAFVRFGHSRAMVADHPDFCQAPDDLNVFAAVCLAVLHRYRGAMGNQDQLSDVSVWNEPANEIEQSTSAFYCRDSTRCTDFGPCRQPRHTRCSPGTWNPEPAPLTLTRSRLASAPQHRASSIFTRSPSYFIPFFFQLPAPAPHRRHSPPTIARIGTIGVARRLTLPCRRDVALASVQTRPCTPRPRSTARSNRSSVALSGSRCRAATATSRATC